MHLQKSSAWLLLPTVSTGAHGQQKYIPSEEHWLASPLPLEVSWQTPAKWEGGKGSQGQIIVCMKLGISAIDSNVK